MDNNLPEGLDDFLASHPNMQEGTPGQAVKAVAQNLLGSGEGTVAQAPQEGVEPESDPITDTIGSAVGLSIADAIANGISHKTFGNIVGNEIGSVGANVKPSFSSKYPGKISSGIRFIEEPKPNYGKVTNDIKQSSKPDYGKVTSDVRDAGKPNYRKVIQKDIKGYADGGEISAGSLPEGLDSFLSEPAISESPQLSDQPNPTAKDVAPQVPKAAEPEGLDSFLSEDINQEKYGTPGQQAIAGLEGAARGVAGPLATIAEKAAGVDPEGILGRSKANPGTQMLGEAGGLLGSMATGLGEGALIGKVGSSAAKAVGEGGNLARLVGSAAARGAVENMLVSGSDEVSKMILNDPGTSVDTAAADVGMNGLLGAGIGGALGSVSPLFKAVSGNKLNQFIEDFRGRINNHISNPDPLESTTNQLKDYYNSTKNIADEVYGPEGLKSQEINKVLPPLNENMLSHIEAVSDHLGSAVDKMNAKPNSYPGRLVSKLNDDLNNFRVALSNSTDSASVFNATQDLKQALQGYAKFDKFVKPVDEAYDFVKIAKDLSHELRGSLENPEIFGRAAERQKTINKAFTEYLPTLKDFEKKFTVEIAGEREIDPGKVQTYLNQAQKATGDVKKKMLNNFLKASGKYRDVIDATHANLGIDSPLTNSPLDAVHESLSQRSPGAKLADLFIEKGLTEASGKGMGAAIGAGIGHKLGHGEVGALLGAHTLGPFLSSILPAIAKPMINAIANGAGVKAASDFGVAVSRGENALNKSIKNIFSAGKTVFPGSMLTSEKDRDRLDKKLASLQTDQSAMLNVGGSLGHYLPAHGSALSTTAMNGATYLNSLRPDKTRQSPLDSKPVASAAAKSQYNRALGIAQQPLSVMENIKNGTVTPSDIMVLKTLYPGLYNSMSGKLVNQLTEVSSKGAIIPYKTRMGLSMFLAQPLDSTMTPTGIMSAQPTPTAPAQPGHLGSPMKHKTAALTKYSSQYRSKGQAAEADQVERQ